MGILVMRGRMMTDDFQLTERSKKWAHGHPCQFKSVAPGQRHNGHEHMLEVGGFK